MRILLSFLLCLSMLATVAQKNTKPSPTTLTASVATAAVGEEVTFTGTGYDKTRDAMVVITSPDGSSRGFYVPVSTDGTISFTRAFLVPGEYGVKAYQLKRRESDNLASTSVLIE
jgi:hypothetical protein